LTNTTRTVHLPESLCAAAEQRFGGKFGSLDQFLVFVMQELVRDDAMQMDQAEQKIIEQRLKDLGYI
jgi:hypothetical protein